MKEKLIRRLKRLEDAYSAMVLAKEIQPSGYSAAQILREQLNTRGFLQSASESLEQTTARAFGMSIRDLRICMETRSDGLSSEALGC